MFQGLAAGIVLVIGLMQTGLIRPYFRNAKIASVATVADVIQKNLLTEHSSEGISTALRETVDNDVCIVIYNDEGRKIYGADSLGAGCIFDVSVHSDAGRQVNSLEMKEQVLDNGGEISFNLLNPRTSQEMIVYGRLIRQNLANYYLYVNSPLEPVDSIVSIFTKQYFAYTVFAILIASVLSFLIAMMVTDPIVRMKMEAQKLSNADYDVVFSGGTFTETQELANTLNEAASKLSKIDELRRDLIANVSHDIRTPLTDIRAYAEMIQDISGDDPVKRNKHLNVIIHETQYMDRLVKDMSELSKMQSGTAELNLENVDLVPVIYDITEMDEQLIEEAGIQLRTELPESLVVYADELKISQVIANYLSNAIKHTPPGRKITIRGYVKQDEETVRIEVADEGEGIDEKDLPYIWDRYQKSSRSFSRNMTSTGLGLAIVKAIVDAHGASYGVESEKGKGSVFWFEMRETHEA